MNQMVGQMLCSWTWINVYYLNSEHSHELHQFIMCIFSFVVFFKSGKFIVILYVSCMNTYISYRFLTEDLKFVRQMLIVLFLVVSKWLWPDYRLRKILLVTACDEPLLTLFLLYVTCIIVYVNIKRFDLSRICSATKSAI